MDGSMQVRPTYTKLIKVPKMRRHQQNLDAETPSTYNFRVQKWNNIAALDHDVDLALFFVLEEQIISRVVGEDMLSWTEIILLKLMRISHLFLHHELFMSSKKPCLASQDANVDKKKSFVRRLSRIL